MPRTSANVYKLPPQATAIAGDVILASNFNETMADIENELKSVSTIATGGTGSNSAEGARENLGINAALALKTNITDNIVYTRVVGDEETSPRSFGDLVRGEMDSTVAQIRASVSAPSGTRMIFAQSAAPTGWTKELSHNDKALRVVSGTVSTGGNHTFSSVFSNKTPSGSVTTTVSGSVGDTALNIAQIPPHGHSISGTYTRDGGGGAGGAFPHGSARGTTGFNIQGFLNINADNNGGGQAHTHTWSGSATSTFSGSDIDLNVAYVDVILCVKD